MSGDPAVSDGAAEAAGSADAASDGSAAHTGSADAAGDGSAAHGGIADGAAASPAEPGAAGERLVIRRRGRRVTTDAPAGYTGEPSLERQQSTENDERLRGDLPPHWGKR